MEDPSEGTPGTSDSTEPCVCCVFPFVHVLMMELNLQVGHSEGFTTVANTETEHLSENTPFSLRAVHSFSLGHPNCQCHYSCAPGPLLTEIGRLGHQHCDAAIVPSGGSKARTVWVGGPGAGSPPEGLQCAWFLPATLSWCARVEQAWVLCVTEMSLSSSVLFIQRAVRLKLNL